MSDVFVNNNALVLISLISFNIFDCISVPIISVHTISKPLKIKYHTNQLFLIFYDLKGNLT